MVSSPFCIQYITNTCTLYNSQYVVTYYIYMKGSGFKPDNSRFGVLELDTLPDLFFRVEHDGDKIGAL